MAAPRPGRWSSVVRRHAQRAIGDDGLGPEFGRFLPHRAPLGVASEVEQEVAQEQG